MPPQFGGGFDYIYTVRVKTIAPMLASLVPDPFDRPGWVYEEKYDGIRTVAVRRKRRVHLWSRNGNELTLRFPAVAEAIAALPDGDLVLDGEVVMFDRHKVSRFQLLQQGGAGSAHPVMAVFDCLQRGDTVLTEHPLSERRRALEAIVPEHGETLMWSRRLAMDGLAAYRFAQQHDWEGIIAKDDASPYQPGKRTRSWLKVKCRRQSEFVIGGFTPPQRSRNEFGALLVGLFDGPRLRYTGKVGTGFSATLLSTLGKQMRALRQSAPPFEPPPRESGAVWIAPRLVAQLAFAEWTADGKLRHPAFLGLRDDKDPKACTWDGREK